MIYSIIDANNFEIDELYVSTLSMDYERLESGDFDSQNLRMFEYLLKTNKVKRFNLLISRYFGANFWQMLSQMLSTLDLYNDNYNDRFRVCITDTHIKSVNFSTKCGKFVNMSGSANLRSSRCLEQFQIVESKDLYDFQVQIFDKLLDNFSMINYNEPYYNIAEKIAELNGKKAYNCDKFRDMNGSLFATPDGQDPTVKSLFELSKEERKKANIRSILNKGYDLEKTIEELLKIK